MSLIAAFARRIGSRFTKPVPLLLITAAAVTAAVGVSRAPVGDGKVMARSAAIVTKPGVTQAVQQSASPASKTTPASRPFSSEATVAPSESAPTVPARSVGVLPGLGVPNIVGAKFYKASRAEFAEFAEWSQRYAQAKNDVPGLVDEGVRLAATRQQALKALIQTDPEEALAMAMPAAVRTQMPAAVEKLLEKSIKGKGDLIVWGAIPRRGQRLKGSPVTRSLMLNNREYSAYTYGASASTATTTGIEVEGIEVDNQVAVKDTAEVAAWGDPLVGTSNVSGKPRQAWTRGVKRLLLIRVDYSDLPGLPRLNDVASTPITPAVAVDLINQVGGVNDFYVENSYNQTSLSVTTNDVTPLYRMPNTALYYAGGDTVQPFSGTLMEAAEAAATAGGYDLSLYDRIGIISASLSSVPGSMVSFAGIGQIQGKKFITSGEYDFRVVAHELGHNYGVYHANWWKPADNSVLGTEEELTYNYETGQLSQVSQDYGDSYDVMGLSGSMSHHFNPFFKSLLNWLPDSAIQSVSTSGTYRLYRFDDANVNLSNKIALQVSRDMTHNFWIGYRKRVYDYPGSNINSGAYITLGYLNNQPSDLLACNNPGVNVTTAALQVGQSLTDPAAGVTITTVATGGTAPNEWVDVQVSLQPRVAFSSNFVATETTQGVAQVLVDREGNANGITSVDYTVVDGSALAGTHFAGSSGSLTWTNGDTASKVLSFPILPYAAEQGPVNFSVQLSNPANAVVITPKTAQVWLMPPGSADPDYKHTTGFNAFYSAAFQPDGKTLLAGSVSQSAPIYNSGRCERILANGSVDESFTPVDADGVTRVVRVQPDGKILLGGAFSNINKSVPARPWLVRLLANGTVDTGFNPPVLDGGIRDIAIQPDGRIVIVGSFQKVNGLPCLGLCRLMPDGSLDFRFNDSNYSLSVFREMRAVVLDRFSSANGVRILAGGDIRLATQSGLYPEWKSGVIRLNPDGSVDSSFAIGSGAHAKNAPGTTNQVFSLAMQPDGKILAGGNFTAFGNLNQKYIVRLNPDGTPDPTFAPSITGTTYVSVEAIAVQPDGKVVFGGFFDKANGKLNKNLIRVTANGSEDITWDNGLNDVNGALDVVSALLFRPDARLLACTLSYNRIRTGGGGQQTLYTGLSPVYGNARLALSTGNVMPGNSLLVTVQRVNGSTGAVQVDYSTQSGTALAGVDYVTAAGTLSWADGDSSPKTFLVTAPPGATLGRKFSINLGIPGGGVVLADPCTATITVGP